MGTGGWALVPMTDGGHLQKIALTDGSASGTVVGSSASPLPTTEPEVTLGHGEKSIATAGAPETLVASTTPVKWVIIEAHSDNTSRIGIGITGVDFTAGTGSGITLGNTPERIRLDYVDLVDIYVDAGTNGDGVRFIYGA